MTKKKILFVYNEMKVGGSTSNLISLLRLLDRNKYELYLQLYKNRGPLFDLIPKYVHVLPEAALPKGKLYKYASMLCRGYLIKALRLKGEDDRYFSLQLMNEFLAKYMSAPCEGEFDFAVGCLEGWADRYNAYMVNARHKYGWLHSVFDKIAPHPSLELGWMRETEKIISVTESCNRLLIETLPETAPKAICIENISDSSLIQSLAHQEDLSDRDYLDFKSADCFKIISAGRLSMHVKGLDRMVRAADTLKKEGFRFIWCIIGDGEDRASISKMIEEYNVGDCIKLPGEKLNPFPYIKAADLMCLPSRWEAKPCIVAESLMLGVPPLVTEYLSVFEQLIDRKTGFVAANDENSFTELLRYCLTAPDEVKRVHEELLGMDFGNAQEIRNIENILF